MKKINAFLLIAAAAASVACHKQDINEAAEGYGSLQVGMSISDRTKAFTQDELYASAKVNIYNADFTGLVRSYNYNEMPSPFYLKAAKYRVDVEAGECVAASPAPASWENKSYKGSESFEIIANQSQTVEVTAYVNNAVSNVSFDPTIAENFNAGYTLTICLDKENSATKLVYDQSKSGADGYFIIKDLIEPSFKWEFRGTLAKDGSEFVKTGEVEGILPGKLYKMNFRYTIKDGDLNFGLYVDYTTEVFDDTIVFEPVATGLAESSQYEIWATRATVHADADPEEFAESTIEFAYSSDGSVWNTKAAAADGNGAWIADLTGLTPSTTYSYVLKIDGEQVGDALSFTTEAAPKIPNGSFEYVSKISGKDYYKFYDPNCGVDEGKYMFWGSGNGEGSEGVNGSANMGIVITVVDTGDKIDGKQSVCAQTSQMAGILAAGNLFTGQFAGLVGTEGGKVNFGRPWTSRPTALKLWCKYTTGKMDIIKGMPAGVTLTKNDYDRAEIKFAIGTWNYKTYGGTPDSPVHVNTTKPSTFVDYNTDGSTIANGGLIIYNDGYTVQGQSKVTTSTSQWLEYTIPLTYRNLNAYPTHIVISCAASQYGDYFTGCSSSKLWIDKVELVY